MPLSDSANYDAIEREARAAMRVSDLHIGEVGGRTAAQTIPMVVTANSAYSSGQVLGGKVQFNAMGRREGLTGLLQMAAISAKSTQSGAIDLLVFRDDPSATVFADKTTLNLAAADVDKLAGVIRINDWTSLGTPSYGQAIGVGIPYKTAAGSTSLWVVPVARASMTFASTSDLFLTLKALQD